MTRRIPFLTAMPPSETNPTRLATLSDCRVNTIASTPPMNAVGMAFRICRTDAHGWIQNHQHDKHSHDRNRRRASLIISVALLLGFKLATELNEVTFRQCHPFALYSLLDSATALARSRSSMLQRITMRRRSVLAIHRVRSTRNLRKVCHLTQFESAHDHSASRSAGFQVGRNLYGKAPSSLMIRSNRRCPSSTCETTSPFMAVCTNSATYACVKPKVSEIVRRRKSCSSSDSLLGSIIGWQNARHRGNQSFGFDGQQAKLIQVITKYLDGNVGIHSRHHVTDHVREWLLNCNVHAGTSSRKFFEQLFQELILAIFATRGFMLRMYSLVLTGSTCSSNSARPVRPDENAELPSGILVRLLHGLQFAINRPRQHFFDDAESDRPTRRTSH